MNKKNLFFITYVGGHANIIDLVAKELLKNTNIKFKILALKTAHKNLINKYSDAIVKSVLDYFFLFEDIQDEVHKYGTLLLKDNYNEI